MLAIVGLEVGTISLSHEIEPALSVCEIVWAVLMDASFALRALKQADKDI